MDLLARRPPSRELCRDAAIRAASAGRRCTRIGSARSSSSTRRGRSSTTSPTIPREQRDRASADPATGRAPARGPGARRGRARRAAASERVGPGGRRAAARARLRDHGPGARVDGERAGRSQGPHRALAALRGGDLGGGTGRPRVRGDAVPRSSSGTSRGTPPSADRSRPRSGRAGTRGRPRTRWPRSRRWPPTIRWPGTRRAVCARGSRKAGRGDPRRARARSPSVPTLPELHNHLGILLARRRRGARARSRPSTAATRLDPNNARAWNNQANALRSLGQSARRRRGLPHGGPAGPARPRPAQRPGRAGRGVRRPRDGRRAVPRDPRRAIPRSTNRA